MWIKEQVRKLKRRSALFIKKEKGNMKGEKAEEIHRGNILRNKKEQRGIKIRKGGGKGLHLRKKIPFPFISPIAPHPFLSFFSFSVYCVYA